MFTGNEAVYQNKQDGEAILKAKRERANEESADCAAGQTVAPQGMTGGLKRSYTLAEEAEKGLRHHAEAHGKLAAAHDFLSRHPQFDEFVRLVRAGSIQF